MVNFTESQNNSAGRELKRSQPTSCSKQGHLWGQTRLLMDLSIRDLKISTSSLGVPFQCLIVLMVGKFSLVGSLNLSSSNLRLLSLALPPHTTEKSLARSSWWPPCSYRQTTTESPFSPACTSSCPSAPPHRARASAPNPLGEACPNPHWDSTRSPP